MMKKGSQNIKFPASCILLLAGALNFISCQKVIDVDLNSASPKIVIEAYMSYFPMECDVVITRTVNFSDKNTFPPVSGALITMVNQIGRKDTIREVSPGVYKNQFLREGPRGTYTISVTVDGITYVAASTMPRSGASISSIRIITETFGPQKGVGVTYTDPPGVSNYYRYIEFRNGAQQPIIFTDNDRFNDGIRIEHPLFEPDSTLKSNDRITIVMENIDKQSFEYYRALDQISGVDGAITATPTNPPSNFNNGALGFFCAYTWTSEDIIVP